MEVGLKTSLTKNWKNNLSIYDLKIILTIASVKNTLTIRPQLKYINSSVNSLSLKGTEQHVGNKPRICKSTIAHNSSLLWNNGFSPAYMYLKKVLIMVWKQWRMQCIWERRVSGKLDSVIMVMMVLDESISVIESDNIQIWKKKNDMVWHATWNDLVRCIWF